MHQQIGTLSTTTNNYVAFKNQLNALANTTTSLNTRVTVLEGGDGPDETRLSALEVKTAPITNVLASPTFKIAKEVEVYGELAELLLHSKKTSAPAYDHSASLVVMDTGALQLNAAAITQDGSTTAPTFTLSGAGGSATLTCPTSAETHLKCNKAFQAKDELALTSTTTTGTLQYDDTKFKTVKPLQCRQLMLDTATSGTASLNTDIYSGLVCPQHFDIVSTTPQKLLKLSDGVDSVNLTINATTHHLKCDTIIEQPGTSLVSGSYTSTLTPTVLGTENASNIVIKNAAPKYIAINTAETDRQYDIACASDYFTLNGNLNLSHAAARKYVLMGNSSNLESNNGVLSLNSPTGNITLSNGTQSASIGVNTSSELSTPYNLTFTQANPTIKLGSNGLELFNTGTQLKSNKQMLIQDLSTGYLLSLLATGLNPINFWCGGANQLKIDASLELDALKSLFFGTTELKLDGTSLSLNNSLKITNGTQHTTLGVNADSRLTLNTNAIFTGNTPTIYFDATTYVQGTSGGDIVAKCANLQLSNGTQSTYIKTNTTQLEVDRDLYVNSSGAKIEFPNATSITGGSSLITLNKNTKIVGDTSDLLTLNNGSEEVQLAVNASNQLTIAKPTRITGTTSSCIELVNAASQSAKLYCTAAATLGCNSDLKVDSGKSFVLGGVGGYLACGSIAGSSIQFSTTSNTTADLKVFTKGIVLGGAATSVTNPYIKFQDTTAAQNASITLNNVTTALDINSHLKLSASGKHLTLQDSANKIVWGDIATGPTIYNSTVDSTTSITVMKTNAFQVFSTTSEPYVRLHNGSNYVDITYKSGTTVEFTKVVKATNLATTNVADVEADIQGMKPIGEVFCCCYASSTPVVPRRTVAKCNGAAFSSATYPALYAQYPSATLPNIADVATNIGWFVVMK